MTHSSKTAIDRQAQNAQALAAFGIVRSNGGTAPCLRSVHEGSGPTVFTVGYERRNGEDLIASLLNAGVEVLVDVRQKAMSRKPDFRGRALQALCEEAGVTYAAMPELGSTEAQRARLKDTGDFTTFRKRFRDYAKRSKQAPLEKLGQLAVGQPIALLCYERSHEECHRSILADLLVEKIDATVVAIT